ncbi:MAG: hypothetical protein WC742_15465, partial [Gallionellaceae bacterium]
MTEYESMLSRRKQQYGDKFDPSELDKRFSNLLHTPYRIKVRFSWGEVKTGTVGITTGWKPVFLLMLTKRSRGSEYILDKNCEV